MPAPLLALQASVEDYPTKAREKWLFDWSSQMILVVNQIYWCQEVEQAFKVGAMGQGAGWMRGSAEGTRMGW